MARSAARTGGGRRAAPGSRGATPERLQKMLARAGLASRREAEAWIRAGRLTINGTMAQLGARVAPRDEVRLDGRLVRAPAAEAGARAFLCHRSAGEPLRTPALPASDPGARAPRAALLERLPRAAYAARKRQARAFAGAWSVSRAHSGGAARAAAGLPGERRGLSVEGSATDAAARRTQQRDVRSGERRRQGQGRDVLRRVGLAAHGGARAPGVQRVHAYPADAFQLRRQHLREPFEGELGHRIRAPVGAPLAAHGAGGE